MNHTAFQCALSLALGITQMQSSVQDILGIAPDQYGRYRADGNWGKVNPQGNVIVDNFIRNAGRKARYNSDAFGRQPFALEVGAAFGFVGVKVMRKNANYIAVDIEKSHIQKLEAMLAAFAPFSEGQTRSEVFAFPFDKRETRDLFKRYRIVTFGSFMVLHFYTGIEILEFLRAVAAGVEEGALVYLTYATPYNALFKSQIPGYEKRKANFFKDPVKAPFPGELPNAWKYLPEDSYPQFFHMLDNDIVRYLGKKSGLELVRTYRIPRPNPEDQAYPRGYRAGKTEIQGAVFRRAKVLPLPGSRIAN